ncbi:hypothetical protein, partial [Escherichia coli]|uniref:hypothetical protein n=1 Tax=Escherichia coli TaxID=562 RepID=UPI001BD46785
FHTIVSIKNDGHYFCRAGGNRPDGLNEPVTDLSVLPPNQFYRTQPDSPHITSNLRAYPNSGKFVSEL